MVLRRGPFGAYMACPDYNADPPCKTVRRLSQKQQQKPAVPLDEKCPKCGKQLVLRSGSYGEFVSCSGYPKCKYIKQNLIEGLKCPKCGEGDIAERKARTGNIFWGCTRYPKCDFTSNLKPVAQKCPQCGSPYVVERVIDGGLYLVCPNNKEMMPRRRPRKGQTAAESQNAVECHFSERIGDAPAPAPRPCRRRQRMGRWWKKSSRSGKAAGNETPGNVQREGLPRRALCVDGGESPMPLSKFDYGA